MKMVRIHPLVFKDVDDAIEWYSQDEGSAVSRFRRQLNDVFREIEQTPKRFVYEPEFDCREAVMMGFPYTVYYREYEDAVWIVACAHQRRRPGYWKDRLSDLPTTD